ncbi:uncharacterized protein PG998_008776 [Apiospora kogelbergensis]|uniref:uncharacterized protein n=1 Tax=Apiospora kogelbergensis TaxID=1337665 RepID=UPI0031314AB5
MALSEPPNHAHRDCHGESTPVDIDPDGDLYLKVGVAKLKKEAGDSIAADTKNAANSPDEKKNGDSPPTTFRVCSRALARASPVWRKMLYGGFAESKPKDGDWIVELPDDDVPAIEFFLSAIHARFDKIPAFDSLPDLSWLYMVSVVADKYDTIRFLRPWAKT